jgi:short-subunit dehydrogenase
VFGLIGVPRQSAYCTSKFAVRGFSEALRAELYDTGVSAVVVHPGGIKTNIARSARFHLDPRGPGRSHAEAADEFERLARTTPERAAQVIHEGVKAGKTRILIGADARVIDALVRVAPERYADIVARLIAVAERRRR